jgi:N-acyl-D-amino-acid deacylase
MDTLIRNGLIVDGRGHRPFIGDVRISGERIEAVTPRTDAAEQETAQEGATTVDATGLVVSPELIDIHSHSDHTVLVDPRAFSSITQGVTLEVVGNCGFGCFPVVDPELPRSRIYAYHDERPIAWRTAEDYFACIDAARPAINIASLVPTGSCASRSSVRPSAPPPPVNSTQCDSCWTRASRPVPGGCRPAWSRARRVR